MWEGAQNIFAASRTITLATSSHVYQFIRPSNLILLWLYGEFITLSRPDYGLW